MDGLYILGVMHGWIERNPGTASWCQAVGAIAAVMLSIYVARRSFYDALRVEEARVKQTQVLMAEVLLSEVNRTLQELESRHNRLSVFDYDSAYSRPMAGISRADMRELDRSILRVRSYLSPKIISENLGLLVAPWGLPSVEYLASVEHWNATVSEKYESLHYRSREELMKLALEIVAAGSGLKSKLVNNIRG